MPWWQQALLWVGGFISAFILLGAIAQALIQPEEGGDDEVTTATVATEAEPEPVPEPAPEPEPEPKPEPEPEPEPAPAPAPAPAPTGPTVEYLWAALDDADPEGFGGVGDVNVKDIQRVPAGVTITLETPEGGFEGPSPELHGTAAAAFEAVINDAGWQKGVTVHFTGGLVNAKTGKDLPDAELVCTASQRARRSRSTGAAPT